MIFWYYRTILGNGNYENHLINPVTQGGQIHPYEFLIAILNLIQDPVNINPDTLPELIKIKISYHLPVIMPPCTFHHPFKYRH